MTEQERPRRLQPLADFLPAFEAPGFQFGVWAGGERSESGAMTLPFFVQSPTATEFVQACYDNGWVLEGFDWPSWKETPEFAELDDKPAALVAATPEQIARLLTVLIRQDRFAEGSLAQHYDSGLLLGILKRATVLAAKSGEGVDL